MPSAIWALVQGKQCAFPVACRRAGLLPDKCLCLASELRHSCVSSTAAHPAPEPWRSQSGHHSVQRTEVVGALAATFPLVQPNLAGGVSCFLLSQGHPGAGQASAQPSPGQLQPAQIYLQVSGRRGPFQPWLSTASLPEGPGRPLHLGERQEGTAQLRGLQSCGSGSVQNGALPTPHIYGDHSPTAGGKAPHPSLCPWALAFVPLAFVDDAPWL